MILRWIILLAALFLSACSATLKSVENFYDVKPWEGGQTVRTRYGLILGQTDSHNTFVWKGIAYAKPPVGKLRWKAPREMEPYSGIMEAHNFSAIAVQRMPIFNFIHGAEDCLTLNVWRPQSKETNLPVYVYVHGGGNSMGSSSLTENYYGDRFASRQNAVYLSINYRLGPMGWFYHPKLQSSGMPEDDSGNYGTLDILFALRWIQENIIAFGGDPKRVIVAGESAGAMNILSLLTSPLAVGLFHGAIIESGVATMNSLTKASQSSQWVIQQLLIRDGKARDYQEADNLIHRMTEEEFRNYLYSKSAQDFVGVLPVGASGMLHMPHIFKDGYVIPKEGYQAFEKGDYPVKIPLIIGCNHDENKIFLYFDKNLDYKSELFSLKARYGSLIWRIRGLDEVAIALSRVSNQPPVYAYRFDWGRLDENGESVLDGELGLRVGASHSIEIPFFLGTGEPAIGIATGRLFTDRNKRGREELSGLIMDYLKGFLDSQNPNTHLSRADLLWTAWTNGEGVKKVLVLDADLNRARLSYLNEVWTLDKLLLDIEKNVSVERKAAILELVTNWFYEKE